ncbi:hypothetical protein SAMN03159494_05589 [Achromobacter sp. NFACC18-2]|nr:hypothetical protein SAMN03159494_05589 [Achromobacter sp. NFACC18-2]
MHPPTLVIAAPVEFSKPQTIITLPEQKVSSFGSIRPEIGPIPFTPRLPVRVSMAYPAQTSPSLVTEAFVGILEREFQALPSTGTA